MPVVLGEGLTKRFAGLTAVDDLSFALEAGTITGFLGQGIIASPVDNLAFWASSDRARGWDDPDLLTSWRSEVAEPWWGAMRERAERDGLRIDCFVGSEGTIDAIPIDHHLAAAALLSPTGTWYGNAWCLKETELAQMASDWGVTLEKARAKANANPRRISALVDARYPPGVVGTAQHMFCGILIARLCDGDDWDHAVGHATDATRKRFPRSTPLQRHPNT